MMKLSQLRNLVAIVEAGTVRKAAKNLNLSQSSLTKSIQQLEDQLGVELLHRGARGIAPTAAGQVLVARSKTIDAELRHARSDIEAMRGATFGEIRVSASPTVAMGLLPQAVAAFQHSRPRVSFFIQEGVYPDILPDVRTGALDFAICLIPGRPRDETLKFDSLVEDRVVPAVRADHPLICARRLDLSDLLDLNWIIYRRSHTGLDIFEQTFIANGLTPPASRVECNSFACALAMVEKGNYATLVPSQIFAGSRRPSSIAPVPLDSPMPTWEVAVISRGPQELSAVCRAFLEELRRVAATFGITKPPAPARSPGPALMHARAGRN
ncbi:MAG: LysR family transcriptional regulator [Bradyrhizobiaceae bacterium]|nr:LysR family transcriptional regulator [Bradyrhizobiaceae bacterium]